MIESNSDMEHDEELMANWEAEKFPSGELLIESVNDIYDNENNSNQQNSDELLSGNKSIINKSSSSRGSYSQQSPDADQLDSPIVGSRFIFSFEKQSPPSVSIDPIATLQHFEDVAEKSDFQADGDNYLPQDTDGSETAVPTKKVERTLEDALGVGASGRTDGTARKRTASKARFEKEVDLFYERESPDNFPFNEEFEKLIDEGIAEGEKRAKRHLNRARLALMKREEENSSKRKRRNKKRSINDVIWYK